MTDAPPVALQRAAQPTALASQPHYRIKRPFWSWFERTFRVFAPDGQLYMLSATRSSACARSSWSTPTRPRPARSCASSRGR